LENEKPLKFFERGVAGWMQGGKVGQTGGIVNYFEDWTIEANAADNRKNRSKRKGKEHGRTTPNTNRRYKETANQQGNVLPHTRETDRQWSQNHRRAGASEVRGIQS
jgi:hypothetical protein